MNPNDVEVIIQVFCCVAFSALALIALYEFEHGRVRQALYSAGIAAMNLATVIIFLTRRT